MSFIIYDLILLGIFVSLTSIFLYKNKKNLQREGLLILYRTSWGIKFIKKVGNENPKTMKFLSYLVILMGYILMGVGVYFVGKIVWIYFTRLDVVSAVKVPPIMPLVPYLPQMFKLSWLPNFYFVYWIFILAIIAITHEFAHGIFAAYHKINIKKTGFGFFPYFLPVFLAAFVELDEERMQKESIFKQLSILGAGTFANIITAILAFILMAAFFLLAFSPAGVVFDSYAYTAVPTSAIANFSSQGVLIENFDSNLNLSSISFSLEGKEFISTNEMLSNPGFLEEEEYIAAYYNSPALKSNLTGVIISINSEKINSIEKLEEELSKYSVGEKVLINTLLDEERSYEIILEENPNIKGKAWIGVGFSMQEGSIAQKINSYKKANVYYTPKFGELSNFIYNLLWWILLISISVAIVNMIPAGIFDGGRFFYLTVLFFTKNQKWAKKSFAFMTYFFLFLIFVVMFLWLKSFF